MPDYLYVILGFVCALVIGLISIPLLIPILRRLKFGQQILVQDGPSWHKKKRLAFYCRNGNARSGCLQSACNESVC